jgi:hypothetical protein
MILRKIKGTGLTSNREVCSVEMRGGCGRRVTGMIATFALQLAVSAVSSYGAASTLAYSSRTWDLSGRELKLIHDYTQPYVSTTTGCEVE